MLSPDNRDGEFWASREQEMKEHRLRNARRRARITAIAAWSVLIGGFVAAKGGLFGNGAATAADFLTWLVLNPLS